MTPLIDPHLVSVQLILIVFLVAGIDIGIAFLMRGEQEAGSGYDDR